MKALCTLSHEVKGPAPGQYRRYVAGREYNIDGPMGPHFEAIMDQETAPSAEAERGVEKQKRRQKSRR
jgi:hypothetical protein